MSVCVCVCVREREREREKRERESVCERRWFDLGDARLGAVDVALRLTNQSVSW